MESSKMPGKMNGVQCTHYGVMADDGHGFWALWRGQGEPEPGTRVKIYHIEDGWNSGGFEIEPIA